MKLTILAAVAAGAALYGCSTETEANASGAFTLEDGASQDRGPKPGSGFSNVPKGVHVVLPKDNIRAVWEPQFVAAGDANMPPDALVIGVVFGGEAHAYSINLLDGHEIVNDVVGGERIAATW